MGQGKFFILINTIGRAAENFEFFNKRYYIHHKFYFFNIFLKSKIVFKILKIIMLFKNLINIKKTLKILSLENLRKIVGNF